MKSRFVACMAAVLLMAALLAACAEGQTTQKFVDLSGHWEDPAHDRASLRIMRAYGTDVPENEYWYDVQLTWAESVEVQTVWRMSAKFDDETVSLDYTDGVKTSVTYDEAGNIVSEEKLWEDSEGALIFIDGELMWADRHEDPLLAEAGEPNLRFKRVPPVSPTAEDFAQRFFTPVAGVESDTAGATLKQAAMVHSVLRFAYDSTLWDASFEGMRDSMLEAWEAMSDEDRAAFDENLMGIVVPLMERVFGDYDAVADQFDDAGVGEDMTFLSRDAEARESWQTLLGNTLTMGNDDET